MSMALAMTGWFMYIDQAITPDAVVVCVVIFNAFFGYSWGPIPWLYPPEIMPLPVRAKAVSLSTATNWAFNWIVGEMTPVLQEWIEWRLYPMHAFFCLTSVILVFFRKPSTSKIPSQALTIDAWRMNSLPRNQGRPPRRDGRGVRRRQAPYP
jgi:hypothetical protein